MLENTPGRREQGGGGGGEGGVGAVWISSA